ncbi:MAG: segregation/condensation protein A [Defluviitaleaceae bacterium]|nr:segregation/condensation protein A [Defluviitaleaceae bacterium]
MKLSFRLDAFEGPMDLLLHLIEKNQINIYDIPVAMITEQYLAHLEQIRQAKDMASISEFLVMAATLLEIKSRMLLPAVLRRVGDAEIDPREELVNRLIEYKKYKRVTADFAEKELVGERYVFRAPDAQMLERVRNDGAPELDGILEGISLSRLLEVCRETLSRREVSPESPEVSYNVLAPEVYTVEDRIEHVMGILANRSSLSFNSLLERVAYRAEVIVTFIAVLELARQQRICIRQDGIFGEILIFAD